jgi:hypothetical protein
MFLPLFENTCACLKCYLYLFGDCVHFCVSWLDASVTGDAPEGGYYQEEEEEEEGYPGHFANQGKPSFESYSKCLVLPLHYTCF